MYWEQNGDERVLAREGDAIYLWDRHGRIVSALAKSGDGSSKRYAPSTAERLHNSFHNLSQALGLCRLMILAVAARTSLWPLLGEGGLEAVAKNLSMPLPDTSSLDLNAFVACLLFDMALDVAQRAAAEHSGTNKRSLSHAVAILGDRLHSALLYGLLVAVFDGSFAAVFLGLGVLDFVSCWLRIRRAWLHPKVLVLLLTRAPSVLPILSLLSETFLVAAALSGSPWLWATISSYPTPPLLWSPVIVSRVLAAACVLRHLVIITQLSMSIQHLIARVDPESPPVLSSSSREGSTNTSTLAASLKGQKDIELDELSDLVRRSYGSIDDFERRHDPSKSSTRYRAAGQIEETISEEDADAFAENENSRTTKAKNNNISNGIVRRSNRRTAGGTSKKISSTMSTMSSVDDDDDTSMDGFLGAGGRDVSPVRPNLVSMRATRLTSLSGVP